MLKSYEGNNPSWKVKVVNDAETTKLEVGPMLSSAAIRKDLQEKTKCLWCICTRHKAQKCNTSLKETEDTKEKNKN